MSLVISFLPFIAFFALLRLVSPLAGLAGALFVSVSLCARVMLRRQSVKLLELGSLIVFAALVLYTMAVRPNWNVAMVRLWVDAGLLAIVVVSLAIGRPFTLQYAREKVDRRYWDTPEFRATSRLIALIWAAAFAVLIAADAAAAYVPRVPVPVDVCVSVVALAGAFWFTGWYPERVRRARGTPTLPR
jgi:hypothetical protein